jgi:hypothetical protein
MTTTITVIATGGITTASAANPARETQVQDHKTIAKFNF